MLFYRKKFLLAVIEAFGGSVEKIQFQKYVFLISNHLNKKYYSFVPYQYGCFSFESYNDIRSLIIAGYLLEDKKKWILGRNGNFLSEMDLQDKEHILDIKKEYGAMSKQELLYKIYSDYPYYAINSKIIQQAGLNAREQKKIRSEKPKQIEKCLFTIGYEGRSIDKYLNILIKNNIKILCDVRKNPLSRKYGFSKQSLKKRITELNMQYLHIPNLGINSRLRKDLRTKQDYKDLFFLYEKEILSSEESGLSEITMNLREKSRVALTCFEAEPEMCHRHCISSTLKKNNPNLKIKHL
ncbi:MAG: DUF488 family protein [Bdellovibrionales bacterium]|nr:DUF488 family protein [Bdellovibrionales bacterium]